MSSRPKLDSTALDQAIGGKAPPAFTREDRVKLIGECAKALLAGRLPSAESRLFTAGALLSWLQDGGSLERDFFRVVKPKSRHTAAYLWREITAHQDEGEEAEGDK